MKVKRVLVAGVELLEVECPTCGLRAFAANGREGFLAECAECGWHTTSLKNADYTGCEVRIARAPTRRGYPRRQVFARDNYTCAYCGWRPTNPGTNREWVEQQDGTLKCNWLSVHHLVPVAQGGNNLLENLVTACWRCHRRFGGRKAPASLL